MKPFPVRPDTARPIRGRLALPGDKSIANRAVIISSLARGTTIVRNFPFNEDCLRTIEVFKGLGVRIVPHRGPQGSRIKVYGRGPQALKKPGRPLYAGDSGTTLRLTMGVLAGCDFTARLTVAKSLLRRPMLRVSAPLRMMGARVTCRKSGRFQKEEYPPVSVSGTGSLSALNYRMPVASAQVKSAILLAALRADGVTRVTEPLPTRDHTERMLRFFGSRITTRGRTISLRGKSELHSPGALYVPGDISSASFFMVLAAIRKNSRIVLSGVGFNPSRMGAVRVLKRMGADIEVRQRSFKGAGFEPAGDITVKSSTLKGTRVRKEEIPSLIDELPVLMVAACFAAGASVFEGVGELRVKETDRINSMCFNLRKMGAAVEVGGVKSDKIIICGDKPLTGCRLRGFGDHRTAMSMVVAALGAQGESVLDDPACIRKSFPEFLSILKKILG